MHGTHQSLSSIPKQPIDASHLAFRYCGTAIFCWGRRPHRTRTPTCSARSTRVACRYFPSRRSSRWRAPQRSARVCGEHNETDYAVKETCSVLLLEQATAAVYSGGEAACRDVLTRGLTAAEHAG